MIHNNRSLEDTREPSPCIIKTLTDYQVKVAKEGTATQVEDVKQGGKKEIIIQEAKVGDIIIYDNKTCIVIGKTIEHDSVRLRVQYNNGITDNVVDDKERYSVVQSALTEMNLYTLQGKIIKIVHEHNGIKAGDIAKILRVNRSKVNSILYKLRNKHIVSIDNNYFWH